MNGKPLVSVVIPVFNYSKYLEDCIRGVLMQKVNFEVEIIFGDDCSTDNSREIILAEIEKNDDPLKSVTLFFHEKNLGPKHFPGKYNWLHCMQAAKGEHIALCDGDDYWTDPNKLQKQIDFLAANPECSGVFHPADWLIEETDETIPRRYKPAHIKEKFTLGDMLEEKGNPVPTCSVLFKNHIHELPFWYQEVDFGDFALDLINMERGPYGFINESMALYREHPHGWHSKFDDIKNLEKQLHFYEKAAENLDIKNMWQYEEALFKLYIELYALSRKVKGSDTKEYKKNAIKYSTFSRHKWIRFQYFHPNAWEFIRQVDYYINRVKRLVTSRA